MRESQLQKIDNVTLEAPFGLEEELHWFYREVLKLDLVDSDQADDARLCFKSARLELRIWLSKCPRIDPIPRRATVLVESLPGVLELLEERSVPYTRLSGVMFTDRRISVNDPAGNRVELKQGWPFAGL